jgi:hypothetical protein
MVVTELFHATDETAFADIMIEDTERRGPSAGLGFACG